MANCNLLKNTGITRLSQFNYITETRSNIIRRYIMLTFSYRLNQGNDKSTIDVNFRK
jgi:hypothetical protein